MKYQKPFDQTDPNAGYVNGNPATGTQGSIPPAEAIEHPQRELADMIAKGGMTPSAADLGQLAKAIQSGLVNYATDTGAANAYVASLSPAPAALAAGLKALVLITNTNAGASTLNLNALGATAIKTIFGTALVGGELVAGTIAEFLYNGSFWQLQGTIAAGITRRRLITPTTIYVDPAAGSDTTGDGSAGKPFATVNKAWSFAQTLDLGGQTLTVSCASGAYAPIALSGRITGQADQNSILVTATGTATVNASGASGWCVTAQGAAQFNLNGPWTLNAPSATNLGGGIQVTGAGSVVQTGNGLIFGPCGSGNHMSALLNGAIIIGGNYTIQNVSAGRHKYASTGQFYSNGAGITVTLQGVPAFTTAFATCEFGYIGEQAITYSGSAIGTRYQANNYGWINTYGGGANFYPGNAAGSGTGTYS